MEIREREDEAIVLDFLPNGYPFDRTPAHKKTAIVQALGTKRFTLLELIPKKDVFLQPGQKVYVGEGLREQIHHIMGRLFYDKLTNTGLNTLENTLSELVMANEQKFIKFFNNAQPMTTRMHQLELIPGLGKKHMWAIIEAREEKPFENFQDLKKRVTLIPNPEKAVIRRILSELEGKEKYKIFTE